MTEMQVSPAEQLRDSSLIAEAAIAVRLCAALDGLSAQLQRQHEREQERLADIWSVPFPAHAVPLSAGAGTLDLPTDLGPATGLFWAIEYITAAGFTAGTVNMYLSGADTIAQSNLRFPFVQAGVWEPSAPASAVLLPGERMVFVASGITGSVVISGKVAQGALRLLPKFLGG